MKYSDGPPSSLHSPNENRNESVWIHLLHKARSVLYFWRKCIYIFKLKYWKQPIRIQNYKIVQNSQLFFFFNRWDTILLFFSHQQTCFSHIIRALHFIISCEQLNRRVLFCSAGVPFSVLPSPWRGKWPSNKNQTNVLRNGNQTQDARAFICMSRSCHRGCISDRYFSRLEFDSRFVKNNLILRRPYTIHVCIYVYM